MRYAIVHKYLSLELGGGLGTTRRGGPPGGKRPVGEDRRRSASRDRKRRSRSRGKFISCRSFRPINTCVFQIAIAAVAANISAVRIPSHVETAIRSTTTFVSGRTRSRSAERRTERRSSRERQDSTRRRSRDRGSGRRTGNPRPENEPHSNNGHAPHDTFGINEAY